MEKLNILVTGGGGFLGKAIVERLLKQGHQVSALGRSPQPELEAMGVQFFRGSITDLNILYQTTKGKQAVFHVAAKAGIWGPWHGFYKSNVVGTQNVIRACHKNGVPFLVHTSTPSVVCNQSNFCNADESLPYGKDWLCHYAHTKAIAEQKVLEVNKPGKLRTIAIRPHLIWGKGDPHIMPRIIEKANKGQMRQIGAGQNLVDITHVKNAAYAHVLALEALIKGHPGGKAYFVSDGTPVNLWQWVSELLERTGSKAIRSRISYMQAYIAGACLEFIYKLLSLKGEPPMTRFVALQLAKSHYFSIRAAKNDLGYTPLIDNKTGLKEIAQAHIPYETPCAPQETIA